MFDLLKRVWKIWNGECSSHYWASLPGGNGVTLLGTVNKASKPCRCTWTRVPHRVCVKCKYLQIEVGGSWMTPQMLEETTENKVLITTKEQEQKLIAPPIPPKIHYSDLEKLRNTQPLYGFRSLDDEWQ